MGTDPGVGDARENAATLFAVATHLKVQLEILDNAGFYMAAAKLSQVLDVIEIDLSVSRADGSGNDIV